MKTHLKPQITLFHSAIPWTSATWDLDTSLHLISFLPGLPHYYSELPSESVEVCDTMWPAKGFERTFCLSASERLSIHCPSRNVIIFF